MTLKPFDHNPKLRNMFYFITVCAKRKQNFMKQYPYYMYSVFFFYWILFYFL